MPYVITHTPPFISSPRIISHHLLITHSPHFFRFLPALASWPMSAPRKTLAPGALAGVSPHESPICLLQTPTALVTGASSSACCLLPSAPACHRLAVQQLHPLSPHVRVCVCRRITSPNLTAVSAANRKIPVFLDSMEREQQLLYITSTEATTCNNF